MNLLNRIDTYRDLINDHLAAVYPEGPTLLRDPIHYVHTAGGKRLRPILTLLTAEVFNGNKDDALHAALAVEMLHNFTLVHDDIMDHDHTRHGRPTVHTRWDEGVAIITGDATFILALTELRRAATNKEAMTDAFTRGALAVCEGQALDKEFETTNGVTLDNYLRMIDLKTGYLLGLAAELGGLCANAAVEAISAVKQFGCELGRAFQIQDDILEIYSDTKTMGKSLGSDLIAEKKTYLFIAAQEQAADELNAVIAQAQNDLNGGVQALRKLLDDTGIHAKAEQYVARSLDAALLKLDLLVTDTTLLKEFASIIRNRRK